MYLKIFASLLLLIFDWHTQVSALARCRKPNGVEGDVRFDGCLKFTCTAINKKKGQWVDSPSM